MGAAGQEWGGVEHGPRWQNFHYLRYATLTAIWTFPLIAVCVANVIEESTIALLSAVESPRAMSISCHEVGKC